MRETESLYYGMTIDPYPYLTLYLKQMDMINIKSWKAELFAKTAYSGTDKSKITRKQSKTSKHGHENQKSTKRSQRIKAEARKVKPQSNPVKEKSTHGQQKSTTRRQSPKAHS
ncbi:hypothetical protein Tco_0033281 [Tanacetum coccineum]